MALPRTLEPEVMDAFGEALAYDRMDLEEVNRQFVADFLAAWDRGDVPGGPAGSAPGQVERAEDPDESDPTSVLDLGTGTGRIPALLCHIRPGLRMLAVDLSPEMLDLARVHIELEGLTGRIRLDRQDAKRLDLPDGSFQAVVSNSLIHHLADPLPALAEAMRVVAPGGLVFARDLARPADPEELETLLAAHAGEEEPDGQQLLRQSLMAALTVPEMQQLVASLGYHPEHVRRTSDRHWTWVEWKK